MIREWRRCRLYILLSKAPGRVGRFGGLRKRVVGLLVRVR